MCKSCFIFLWSQDFSFLLYLVSSLCPVAVFFSRCGYQRCMPNISPNLCVSISEHSSFMGGMLSTVSKELTPELSSFSPFCFAWAILGIQNSVHFSGNAGKVTGISLLAKVLLLHAHWCFPLWTIISPPLALFAECYNEGGVTWVWKCGGKLSIYELTRII